ncbi:hypothetical protein E6H14_00075 [Candidatus Bathyarchaeota archaeon]|nr:MAG: hypothetical protein E6H14_00075 [Candidatus Bathyarchaeota archaeon]
MVSMDQIRHLTGIVGQMMCSEIMAEPLGQIETSYDRRTDRRQGFRGIGLADKKEYVFDENFFRWKTL